MGNKEIPSALAKYGYKGDAISCKGFNVPVLF